MFIQWKSPAHNNIYVQAAFRMSAYKRNSTLDFLMLIYVWISMLKFFFSSLEEELGYIIPLSKINTSLSRVLGNCIFIQVSYLKPEK